MSGPWAPELVAICRSNWPVFVLLQTVALIGAGQGLPLVDYSARPLSSST
jgi:hypothetical protein